MDSIPETKILLTNTAPAFGGTGAVNTGNANILLTEPKYRTRTQDQIVQDMQRSWSKLNFGRISPSQEPTIAVQRGRIQKPGCICTAKY